MKGISNWVLLLSHWTIITCLVWLVQYMVMDLWINQDTQWYCSYSKFKLDLLFWYPNEVSINIKNITGREGLLNEIFEWSRKLVPFFSTYANVCECMSNNLLLFQQRHFFSNRCKYFTAWSPIIFSIQMIDNDKRLRAYSYTFLALLQMIKRQQWETYS